MTDRPIEPDENEALAGELALRVLSPADEAAARRRAETDPAFAADVDAWNEHLTTLSDEIAPVEPSAGVWPRIFAAVSGVANDNERLTFWRRWAVGSTGLLAASLAAVAVMIAQPNETVVAPAPVAQPAVTRVATLSLEGGESAVTLVYDTASGRLFIAPTDAMEGDARVPHLWLMMPEGGVRLVGAIDGQQASRQRMSEALSGAAGSATAVAISMEAPGHTPALDKPDGPVIASGELQQL